MTAIPPILARRVVSENRFLRYVEEDLHDRHGRPYTYYQVESKWDAVLAVPVLPDGRLVVERIYRHPYRRWFREFPAGGIEPNEDPRAAAGRELLEETGWRANKLTLLGTQHAMPGLLKMRLHVVLAEDLVPGGVERKLEEMEMIEVEELTEAEAWAATEDGDASSFLSLGLLYLARWRQVRG
ncbi:MAG: NUDIX hydrolase [Planctomycetes bacterium]|nr:NUDIX hydrolase [Planctomycetota bacterium]